jgi:hypothetical protein
MKDIQLLLKDIGTTMLQYIEKGSGVLERESKSRRGYAERRAPRIDSLRPIGPV